MHIDTHFRHNFSLFPCSQSCGTLLSCSKNRQQPPPPPNADPRVPEESCQDAQLWVFFCWTLNLTDYSLNRALCELLITLLPPPYLSLISLTTLLVIRKFLVHMFQGAWWPGPTYQQWMPATFAPGLITVNYESFLQLFNLIFLYIKLMEYKTFNLTAGPAIYWMLILGPGPVFIPFSH